MYVRGLKHKTTKRAKKMLILHRTYSYARVIIFAHLFILSISYIEKEVQYSTVKILEDGKYLAFCFIYVTQINLPRKEA